MSDTCKDQGNPIHHLSNSEKGSHVSKPLAKTSIFLFVLESCYIYDFSNKTSTQVGNIPSGLLISL